jgi:hypothetical protein
MTWTDDALTVLASSTDEQLAHVRGLTIGQVEGLERLADEARWWAERALQNGSPTADLLEQEASALEHTLTLARVTRDQAELEGVLSGSCPLPAVRRRM